MNDYKNFCQFLEHFYKYTDRNSTIFMRFTRSILQLDNLTDTVPEKRKKAWNFINILYMMLRLNEQTIKY